MDRSDPVSYLHNLSCAAYCKRITFCLVPLAVDILPLNQVHRRLCIYKVLLSGLELNAKSNPHQIAENLESAKYRKR